MSPLTTALIAIWVSVIAYWVVAAWFTKRKVRSQPTWITVVSMIFAIATAVIGAQLLHAVHLAHTPLFPASSASRTVCVALVAIGAALGVWGRRTIGSNWSGNVTVKENHTLVQTGPYRLMRHPIYTALLTMAFATAVYYDTISALYGAVLCLMCLIWKMRLEERWMTEEFGDSYRDYKRKVKALVPGLI